MDPGDRVLSDRLRGHDAVARGFTKPKLDMVAQGLRARLATRGREQQLIDFFGGAQSEGGTSGNLIRGVSKINPQGRIYHGESNRMFGSKAPFTGLF